METQTSKLIMHKDDFNALTGYINKNQSLLTNLQKDSLLENIEDAELMDGEDFPWEIIRLNTRVVIRDKVARYNFTYTLVLPEFADHRKCKVSVFSPIGSALFGRRRGDDTYWATPKGKRYFTIMAVSQSLKQNDSGLK